jgi:hypothetical protein
MARELRAAANMRAAGRACPKAAAAGPPGGGKWTRRAPRLAGEKLAAGLT